MRPSRIARDRVDSRLARRGVDDTGRRDAEFITTWSALRPPGHGAPDCPIVFIAVKVSRAVLPDTSPRAVRARKVI